MTGRLLAAVSVLLVTGLSALSLGGPVFYFVSWALVMMIAYAVISLVAARYTLRFAQRLDEHTLERGDTGTLHVGMHLKSPLPIGPARLPLTLPQGEMDALMQAGFLRENAAAFSLRFPHVGQWPVGVNRIILQDFFGFLRWPVKIKNPLPQALVLPRQFEVQPLDFARMDDGRALPGRSGEDVTSPEDTRAYRLGDPFKRIHWKLSIRARELIVRRFEIPEPPDTLILLDCTAPLGGEKTPDGKARLMDTLSETALSVAAMQMTDGQPVRLPFYGSRQSEFHADRQESLAMLKEELARQAYSGGVPFERVLNLELRRMRRTGATIVITTRLDAQVTEGVKNIRASGPNVRFYLITFTMNAPEYSPYIALLQQNLVEVCYVTPA
ncbi:MAG: DUF58 domain-containing protein [Christensenellales bacterium]|jgi:uncharacterized protein (DUF58 family)